jgi:acetyl esterase/lipase
MYNVAFNTVYQNFAASDFVVLYTNPRGSTGYGSAFGNAIHHNYPGPDYDDLMAAVDLRLRRAASTPIACTSAAVPAAACLERGDRPHRPLRRRRGALPGDRLDELRGPHRHSVVHVRVVQEPFWEVRPGSTSSLMYVGSVKTPTLLMTGELDMRTPMPQTEEYYAALKMRGVPAALLRFEGEYHGTGSKPTNWMRTQLYMMSWYNQWTKKGPIQAGRPVP